MLGDRNRLAQKPALLAIVHYGIIAKTKLDLLKEGKSQNGKQ